MKNLTKVSWGAASALSVVLLGSGVARADWSKASVQAGTLTVSNPEVKADVKLVDDHSTQTNITSKFSTGSVTQNFEWIPYANGMTPGTTTAIAHVMGFGATLNAKVTTAVGPISASATVNVYAKSTDPTIAFGTKLFSFSASETNDYRNNTVITTPSNAPAEITYARDFPVVTTVNPNGTRSHTTRGYFDDLAMESVASVYASYRYVGPDGTYNYGAANSTSGASYAFTQSVEALPPIHPVYPTY